MASRRTSATTSAFDDKLARIRALADAPPASPVPDLRRFLADPAGYLVGEAAKVAAALELRDLIPDLAAAFLRLIEAPATSDKGCHGKKRIVEALLQLDADTPEVYLAGLRCVQREGAFGEPIDTAAPLRGLCAHALFHIDHRDALAEVAPLLMDRELEARSEAAAALGSSDQEACGALLHLKVLAGDKEPDVLGACYKALLRIAPRRYLPLVAEALGSGDAAAEAAAIALGESRLPEAVPLLQRALASAGASRHDEGLLLGLALHRSDEASAHLLSLLERAPEARAAAALNALALHRHDDRLAARVRAAVAARGSSRLQRVLEDRFGA